MVVLVKEPGKEVYRKDIDNTLESLQNIVDGCIELVPCGKLKEKDILILGNEEARLLDLKENLIVLNKKKEQVGDVRGTLIYLGDSLDGDFKGLDEDQINYLYSEIFNSPYKAVFTDGLIVDCIIL